MLLKSGLLLSLVVVAVWSPSLANGFVWDDINNIVLGTRLREWHSLIEVFRHSAMWSAHAGESVGTYRPLALASFVVDYRAFGLWAPGYHLSSVLLHACVTLAVFVFSARWLSGRAAFWLALVFGVHPLGVEAVGWINGRSEPFALLFGLGALILASRGPIKLARATGISFCLFASLLGKETGIAFVPLAVFFAAEAEGRRFHPIAATAGIVASFAYFLLRSAALGDAVGGGVPNLLAGVPVVAAVWYRALQATLFPLERALVNMHPWLTSLSTAELVAYWGLSLFFAAAAVVLYIKGRRVAALGLVWWAVVLVPVTMLAFQALPGLYRWLYIGLPGMLLAVFSLIPDESSPRIGYVFGAVALVYIVQTERAIPVWQSNRELFLTMADESEDDPFALLQLVNDLVNIGRFEEAEQYLERAEKLGTTWTLEVRQQRAFIRLGQGRCVEGAQIIRDGVPGEKVHPVFFELAGNCFQETGDPAKAAMMFRACEKELPKCRAALQALRASPKGAQRSVSGVKVQ